MGSKAKRNKGYGKKKKGRSKGGMGNSDDLFLLAQAETAAAAHARQQQNVPDLLDLSSHTDLENQQLPHPKNPILEDIKHDELASAATKEPSSSRKIQLYGDVGANDINPGITCRASTPEKKGKGKLDDFDPAAIIRSRAHPTPGQSLKPYPKIVEQIRQHEKESGNLPHFSSATFLHTGAGVTPQPTRPAWLQKRLDMSSTQSKKDKMPASVSQKPKKSSDEEFNDRIRKGFGGGDKKKAAKSPASQDKGPFSQGDSETHENAEAGLNLEKFIEQQINDRLQKWRGWDEKEGVTSPAPQGEKSINPGVGEHHVHALVKCHGCAEKHEKEEKAAASPASPKENKKPINLGDGKTDTSAPASSKSSKTSEQIFNDRIRNGFGGGNKKKTATSPAPESKPEMSVSVRDTPPKSFPQWSKLPEALRAYILSEFVCTSAEYCPTYGQHSVLRGAETSALPKPSPVPLDFILGPRNKAFAQAGLLAFYAGHTFNFYKPRESLHFLKQIGDDNLHRLNRLTITLSRDNTDGTSKSGPGGPRLEKLWVNTLNNLAKRGAMSGFEFLCIIFTQGGERMAPEYHVVPGTRLTMEHEDDRDPLHDFTDDTFRFGPTSYMYPTSIANDYIRALVKIRGVKYPYVMLGTLAGEHWDQALMYTMSLPATPESEADPIVCDIKAAWKARIKMEEEASGVDMFRRFKLE